MKWMQMEYEKVIQHNAISGNEPAACPYFQEMDQILKGDATIQPPRAAHSLPLGHHNPTSCSQVSTGAPNNCSSSYSGSQHPGDDVEDAGEGTSSSTTSGEDRNIVGMGIMHKEGGGAPRPSRAPVGQQLGPGSETHLRSMCLQTHEEVSQHT